MSPLNTFHKLRQFVDTGGPKQPSNSSHSRVVARRLHNVRPVFLDGHGSKFQYDEVFTVKPLSDLSKNDRTWTVQFDCNGSKSHDRQKEYQHE